MAKQTLNARLIAILEGREYIPSANGGLRHYHVAQDIKAALRRKCRIEKSYALRAALKHYRITVTVGEDNQIILVSSKGQEELIRL